LRVYRDLGLRLPRSVRLLPALAGRNLCEQAAKGGEAVAGVEGAQHRPERSLIGCHDGLVELLLPAGDRAHGREISAGDDKGLDLGPVNSSESLAGVFRTELPDRIGIGRAKAFERDGFEPVLSLDIS